MRNDYVGYGILKDMNKYQKQCLDVLIKESMSIEEKTLIRIDILSLNYKDLVKRVKSLKHTCVPWRGRGGDIDACVYCGKVK